MFTVRGEKYGLNYCSDRETQLVSFPLQHFRNGRDYGRITLRNMDGPNQIKAKTIKARVKATAVSSFKCRPPPPQLSKSVTLNCFHPQSFFGWGQHKSLSHEYWTVSAPDINPSKQSKQGRKAPMII